MNKKVVISIALFLFVFCVLGIPFTTWWFFGADDFHALYLGYQTKTVKQLMHHFIDGNIAQGAGPSNYIQSTIQPTFFSVYYRPLYLVYLTFQYWLFGTNAYYYHLCNVFFHALNAALLFTIFCWFSPIAPAFIATLLFAVHPQIGYRFGTIVNLHYYINVTLLLGVVMLYKKWLDTKNPWSYFVACLFFALSLLTRESSIIFPALLFLGTYVYRKDEILGNHIFVILAKAGIQVHLLTLSLLKKIQRIFCKAKIIKFDWIPAFRLRLSRPSSLASFGGQVARMTREKTTIQTQNNNRRGFTFPKILNIFKEISGFIIIACSFLVWRLYLYPLGVTHSSSSSISSSCILRVSEFKVFLYDLFTLSWLPWGKPLLRAGLLTGCFVAFFMIFISCTKKIEVCMLLCAGSLMLWPVMMGPYSPRYLYEAWPFFLAGFLVCFVDNRTKLIQKMKPYVLTFFTVLIFCYTAFCYDSFRRRTIKHHSLSNAVYNLLKDQRVQQRPLCFLGQPLDGMGEQNPDIFRILLNQPDKIIYFDSSTAITQTDQNIVKVLWWGNIMSSYHDINYVSVTPFEGGFRFRSHDPGKVFFTLDSNGYSLGNKVIHRAQNTMVTDFSLFIDQVYLDQDPLFVLWDFEKKAFIIHERF